MPVISNCGGVLPRFDQPKVGSGTPKIELHRIDPEPIQPTHDTDNLAQRSAVEGNKSIEDSCPLLLSFPFGMLLDEIVTYWCGRKSSNRFRRSPLADSQLTSLFTWYYSPSIPIPVRRLIS